MNRFPTLMVLAALAGLVSGCRKSLREPPDWNLEKHLGQRNRPDPRANPAPVAVAQTRPAVESAAPRRERPARHDLPRSTRRLTPVADDEPEPETNAP